MDPKNINIKDFTYELPESKIAKYPLNERDSSKLLIYHAGIITEDFYKNIAAILPKSSLLIFNDTKVINARILFQNAKAEKIEIFCLEPAEEYSELESAMSTIKSIRWKCLVGRMNKWKEKILILQTNNLTVSAEIIGKQDSNYVIEFHWQPEELSFSEILELIGVIPIPPYLRRDSEDMDNQRYQTVYAHHDGSVAAPTAGLHFTKSIMDQLAVKGISHDFLTLHVGAGTFKPVKTTTLDEHEMHSEWIDVGHECIERILRHVDQANAPLIAVGTTSLRTMESLYWMGVKAKDNPKYNINQLEIKQWDPYELDYVLSTHDALVSLLSWMRDHEIKRLICKTQIIIVPGYKLKIADALITNFHQPNSTLLLLVAAVVGDSWKTIYEYALTHQFRFLSYGDGSLLFKNTLA